MSDWFDELLESALGDNYGALGAPPLKLLKGYPSAARGQARPGHLSVDAKLREARAKFRARAKAAQSEKDVVAPVKTPKGQVVAPVKTPKGQVVAPVKTPKGQVVAPVKTPKGQVAAPVKTPKGQVAAPGAIAPKSRANQGAGNLIAPAARGRTVKQITGALNRSADARNNNVNVRLAGPDDEPTPDVVVPFTPNAQVWVTNQVLPIRGVDPATGGPGTPINWPDGTPAAGVYWLPKLNLAGALVPGLPGTKWQGDNPITRGRRQERNAGWMQSTAAQNMFGGPAWEWLIDYGKGLDQNGLMWAYPEPPSAAEPFGSRHYHTVHDHVDRDISDWDGHSARINRHAATFDWSNYPPSVQAPIYLWLNLWNPIGVSWSVQEAEIYRADLQDIATAGEPTSLPGAGWLCLDVLDAMQTGAHGFPVLVTANESGAAVLDKPAFTQFLADHPEWVPLLELGRNNAGMLAIINDLGARAGGKVYAPPPPPPPPPPPVEEEIPVEELPVDPFEPLPGEEPVDPFYDYYGPPGPGGSPLPGYDPYNPYGYPRDPYGGEFDLNWFTSDDFAPAAQEPYYEEPIAENGEEYFVDEDGNLWEFVEEDAGELVEELPAEELPANGWPDDAYGDGWLVLGEPPRLPPRLSSGPPRPPRPLPTPPRPRPRGPLLVGGGPGPDDGGPRLLPLCRFQ